MTHLTGLVVDRHGVFHAHGAHAVPPLQQPLPPQGQLYGQHMYGQGQQLYGSQASIYGGGLPVPGRDPAADAPGLPSAQAPPLLRDINSYAQASPPAYPGSSYAAAVAAHHAPGYPPQSQSYVGQQPYGGQPYVSSQQAAYSAGQYSGQQAAYAAGQQAYQTAAATASSGYGTAYPPQAASTYGAPPGYGAPYGQQAATYPANPTAYATAGYGLGQSPYNYLQQPAGAGGASGVVAYGSYQGAQSQVPQTQQAQPLQYTQPQADPSVATGSLADQSQQQYLDMVWQLSDMSLNDKQAPLPAPPNQQPPAPPAHMPQDGVPAAGSSAAVWNSFDDAAAKGMVDGLVGGDDASSGPPPLPPPPPNTAMWTSH